MLTPQFFSYLSRLREQFPNDMVGFSLEMLEHIFYLLLRGHSFLKHRNNFSHLIFQKQLVLALTFFEVVTEVSIGSESVSGVRELFANFGCACHVLWNMILINKMHRAYKWHQIAFIKELQGLLSQIGGQNINYLEFQLLKDQAGLVFVDLKEETRCMTLFKKFGFMSKKELVSSIALVQSIVKHCKKQYVIRLRPTSYEIQHCGNRCFQFWMKLMKQRYGTFHIWFEELCQERDIRRVSIQRFLGHLNTVLKGSLHQNCSQKISMLFQKSKRNQIQFPVFMNTIIINRKLLSSHETSKESKDNLSMGTTQHLKKAVKTETKETQSMRQTGYSSPRKLGRRSKWSAASSKNRYTTLTKLSATLKNSRLPFDQ